MFAILDGKCPFGCWVMKSIRMLFVFSCVLLGICHAAEPSDSPSAAQRWVGAKFLGVKEPPGAEKPFLEAQLKPDALVRDRIEGRPLLIVQQKFNNGIAMRSPGEILVHLSSSASSFAAKRSAKQKPPNNHAVACAGSSGWPPRPLLRQ